MSEMLVFGIVVGCLQEKKYYYKCCHCKIWTNFLVTLPLILSQYFSSYPLFSLKAHFSQPPSNPTSPPYLITNERSCSMERMCSFLRRHFMRKPVVVSKNVGSFLSLFILHGCVFTRTILTR